MPESVSGLVEYHEAPDPETARRRARFMWLLAAISILMMVAGYLLIAYILLA